MKKQYTRPCITKVKTRVNLFILANSSTPRWAGTNERCYGNFVEDDRPLSSLVDNGFSSGSEIW